VLDADATLRFPDFRSEERTFALIAQLAGRTGRGGTPGRVLVQTLAPTPAAIVYAARDTTARASSSASSSAARRSATRRTAS
jgi:primosomal protein N'